MAIPISSLLTLKVTLNHKSYVLKPQFRRTRDLTSPLKTSKMAYKPQDDATSPSLTWLQLVMQQPEPISGILDEEQGPLP